MSSEITTQPQQGPPLSAAEILHNAQALAAKIHEADLASEYDKLRKLPTDIVEQVRATGVMRMNMPRSWGGPEMSAMEQVEVIEALSRADASVGWCSFIWCDSGIYSGYLDDAVGRRMYPRLDMATSGWVYPVGKAHRVAGGYRLSGEWMFGSGCNHCDWLAAGCIVYRDGKAELDPSGKPLWRILMAQPHEYEIQDTWYTTGLRGTGSNDYRCEDLFVPQEHSFSFQEPAKRTGTIWAKPDHLLRKMAGVPLGVAADAIDYAKLALSDKLDRRSGVLYRDMPKVQYAIAEAHSILGAARSYVFSSLEAQWRKLETGQPLTEEERANAWLSRTNAFQAGRKVVTLMYDTIGGNAIYARRSPLDRHLRDINTACQHMVGQTRNLEGVGSLLLGGEPANSMM